MAMISGMNDERGAGGTRGPMLPMAVVVVIVAALIVIIGVAQVTR
jgi:hypothetical protein